MKLGLYFSLAAAVHTLHLLSFLPIFAVAQNAATIANLLCKFPPPVHYHDLGQDTWGIQVSYNQDHQDLINHTLGGYKQYFHDSVIVNMPEFMSDIKYYGEVTQCPQHFAIHDCTGTCLPLPERKISWPPKCRKDGYLFNASTFNCKNDLLDPNSADFNATFAKEVICNATGPPKINHPEPGRLDFDITYDNEYLRRVIIYLARQDDPDGKKQKKSFGDVSVKMPLFMQDRDYFGPPSVEGCPYGFARHKCTRTCLPFMGHITVPPSCSYYGRESKLKNVTYECLAPGDPCIYALEDYLGGRFPHDAWQCLSKDENAKDIACKALSGLFIPEELRSFVGEFLWEDSKHGYPEILPKFAWDERLNKAKEDTVCPKGWKYSDCVRGCINKNRVEYPVQCRHPGSTFDKDIKQCL